MHYFPEINFAYQMGIVAQRNVLIYMELHFIEFMHTQLWFSYIRF